MSVILTDRSRSIEYQRCHRSRWWSYQYKGLGVSQKRINIPLAVGTFVHEGLAQLLLGNGINAAIGTAISGYDAVIESRGLNVEANEEVAFVYAEQRALVEALVRMYGYRGYPSLLSTHRVIEVEREDLTRLRYKTRDGSEILFMSRADGLLQRLDNEAFEVLSFKTANQWDNRKDSAGDTDMQGLSETYGIEQRLTEWWWILRNKGEIPQDLKPHPALIEWLKILPVPPRMYGVRMEYLIKGERRAERGEDGLEAGTRIQRSPLIRGYRKDLGGVGYQYAHSFYWKCSESHPMRKSKWYPDGRCPGDGRKHRLSEDYQPFSVWEDQEVGGVEGWIERLHHGLIQPEAGDCLEGQFLVRDYSRQQEDMERWYRQISWQELEVAERTEAIRRALPLERGELMDRFFPMYSHSCEYPSACPNKGICFESHVEDDPIASGLYIWRAPHHEPEVEQRKEAA